MGYITDAKNDALDALVGTASWIVPCTGDPGTTGANQAAVSPQQTTWGAAASGIKTGSQLTFSSAPALSYTHYAAFEDEALTTFRFGFGLDPAITLSGTGTLYITPRAVFTG